MRWLGSDYISVIENTKLADKGGVEINEYEIYKMNVVRNKSFKAKKLYTIKLKYGLDYKKTCRYSNTALWRKYKCNFRFI